LTGVGIAVVDFPDSLLAPAQRHSSRNAELWVEANTAVIPSEGTPVRLILRPATVRRYEVALDFRGDFWTDGRYCRLADLAELVHAARQLDPAYVQTVTVRGALRSDERWAERALHEVGIPAEALVLQRAEPSGAAGARADRPARFPPADPSGGD
jgi:hypothetical protein